MNYYIQGDAANADKIKAAFEAKEIYSNFNFANENYLYYSCDGEVAFCFICGGLANIIKTHPDYKELELPVRPKFKIGDWIACDADSFTLSIKSVRDENYYFHQGGSLPIKDIDEHYHLWTIADAKDGDILSAKIDGDDYILIFKQIKDGWIETYGHYYITIDKFCVPTQLFCRDYQGTLHPATQEQCKTLFKKMKEAGYQWDAEKKELRKIQPHYDIKNFHVGMPVLVREYDTCHWQWVQYSHFNGVGLFFAAGKTWRQCIPFEGNEHLLGTTDMCDEMYINW